MFGHVSGVQRIGKTAPKNSRAELVGTTAWLGGGVHDLGTFPRMFILAVLLFAGRVACVIHIVVVIARAVIFVVDKAPITAIFVCTM